MSKEMAALGKLVGTTKRYVVAIQRTTYYAVITDGDEERAESLAFGDDSEAEHESVDEIDSSTTDHWVNEEPLS